MTDMLKNHSVCSAHPVITAYKVTDILSTCSAIHLLSRKTLMDCGDIESSFFIYNLAHLTM